jgi:hypothetical protein
MILLKTPTEISNKLKEIEPAQIAVAYVGADWKSFLNSDHIENIIISPTLGSNPRAIT